MPAILVSLCNFPDFDRSLLNHFLYIAVNSSQPFSIITAHLYWTIVRNAEGDPVYM